MVGGEPTRVTTARAGRKGVSQRQAAKNSPEPSYSADNFNSTRSAGKRDSENWIG